MKVAKILNLLTHVESELAHLTKILDSDSTNQKNKNLKKLVWFDLNQLPKQLINDFLAETKFLIRLLIILNAEKKPLLLKEITKCLNTSFFNFYPINTVKNRLLKIIKYSNIIVESSAVKGGFELHPNLK